MSIQTRAVKIIERMGIFTKKTKVFTFVVNAHLLKISEILTLKQGSKNSL